MSGFQFMHAEIYARSGSALKGAKRSKDGSAREKGSGGWSARQIMSEVMREPQASHHVPSPLPPELLFGEVNQLIVDLDNLGPPPKGTRKDTPILMACIASAPWPPGDQRSVAWRADAIDYFKNKFGDYLKAVVGHSDEVNDHIHLYIARPDYSPIKTLHPGMLARDEVKANKGLGFELAAAYTAAMRAWQDEYNLKVGMAHAQTRFGPRRQRLGRGEWKAQMASAEHSADALKAIAAAQESARLAAHEMAVQARLITARAEEAAEMRMHVLSIKMEAKNDSEMESARLQMIKTELDAERARQTDMLSEMKRAHAFNKAKSEDLVKKEVALEIRVQEVAKKESFLNNLLSDFYATMERLHQRMSFTDKGAIEHLLAVVDGVKEKFNKLTGKTKVQGGLDL